MQMGLIGLGRMGAGLAQRLLPAPHAVAGFDMSRAQVEQLVETGAAGARSLHDLASQLAAPRAVWVMVPHGDPTRTTIETLLPLLAADDVIIDGGNSRYTDSIAQPPRCREHGVHFLDVGVSGGVWGLAEGFNLMIGGPPEAFRRLEPVFQALAPPDGYAQVGPSGAGHFLKMVHNAIQYGMLQALGEGLECLERSEFNLDLTQVAGLWEHGAVVRSCLTRREMVPALFALHCQQLLPEQSAVVGFSQGDWDSTTFREEMGGRWRRTAEARGTGKPSRNASVFSAATRRPRRTRDTPP